jgi:hypothetical protein
MLTPTESWHNLGALGLGCGADAGTCVYLAYSDESGIGNERKEPFVLVTAVVIHVETQWDRFHDAVEKLIAENVPIERRTAFEFHAHDLMGN